MKLRDEQGTEYELPDRDTPAYMWWQRGAYAEHAAMLEGMDAEAREAFDVIKQLLATRDRLDALETTFFIFLPSESRAERRAARRRLRALRRKVLRRKRRARRVADFS